MESSTKGTSTQAAPRFELGELCYTPGAQEVMQRYQISPFQLIARHVTGDWGDVCPEDAQTNEEALQEGARIFSVYVLATTDVRKRNTVGCQGLDHNRSRPERDHYFVTRGILIR